MGVDVAMLVIIEDELPIFEQIKRRQMTADCWSYVDPPEVEENTP